MKTKTKAAVQKLTTKQRFQDLRATIDICFAALSEHDYKEICNLTGLHLSTIYRLANGEYTLRMQVNTLQVLAAAAGLRVTTAEYGYEIRLVH